MRRKQEKTVFQLDDADAAAGLILPTPPVSRGGMSAASDLDFFEDLVSEPVLVLGFDISHMSRNTQFIFCASGVFWFSLLYGYLQELLSVQLCSRQLGLFLAMAQFIGYTMLAYVLRTYVYRSQNRKRLTPKASNLALGSSASSNQPQTNANSSKIPVPLQLYMALSLLRAIDLGMTNLAMQYINYPAKTLMKSSRVVFTMIFGVFITKKRYQPLDYFIVCCMVAGLAIFMHADANSSAVFQPLGVIMLTVSLICDGAITNMSESIMNNFGVGQDEFIFRMYSIALIAITGAAAAKGDLRDGIVWMIEPGTYAEQQSNVPLDQRQWSVMGKFAVICLFSSMGFFGSSCSAAITKQFGALTMSITSTARKATTLFLSFFLFDNVCTFEHIVGVFIFIMSLVAKSFRRKGHRARNNKASRQERRRMFRRTLSADVEPGRRLPPTITTVDSGASADDTRSEGSLNDIHDASLHSLGTPTRNSPKPRYHVV